MLKAWTQYKTMLYQRSPKPSARGRQKIARADKIMDPVGPTGRLKYDQTLTLSYYLFLYFRELELTYRCKDCPGHYIWRPRKRISFMSTSFRPTLPPSTIIPYNVQMLTKQTCEQCIIICYWLSSGPRSVTYIGRANNVMKSLDRRISIISGNFVYFYLFFLSNP